MRLSSRIQSLFILFAILASIWVVKERIQIEREFKEVDLAIDYKGVRALSLEYGVKEEDIFKKLMEAGITSVVVHEDTLKGLHDEGCISMVSTNQLLERARIDTFTGFNLHPRFTKTLLGPDTTYLLMKDPSIFYHLYNILPSKIEGPIKKGRERGLYVIEFEGVGERFGKIGVGFLPSRIEALSKLGLDIMIIPNHYGPFSKQIISKVFNEVGKIRGVRKACLKDGLMWDLDHLKMVITKLRNWGMKVAVLEREDLSQIRSIYRDIPNLVVRTYMIPKERMDQIGRFIRAVKEENIRCLYLLPILNGRRDLIEVNAEYVKSIKEELTKAGYRIGTKNTMPNKIIPMPLLFLISIGIPSMLILLLDKVTRLSWEQKAFFLFIGVVVLGVGLWKRVFFQQFWALGISILFPMLGILIIKPTNTQVSFISTIGWCLRRVLIVCGVTSLGALFIVGLMSEIHYLLKIDHVWGMSLSFLLPILGVWIFYGLKERGMEGLLLAPIHLLGFFLFIGFLLFVILRSTEYGSILFPFEARLAWLRFMGFLIGYPALFLGIYLLGQGYKSGPLLGIGTLSQVSLMNTYLQFHTPFILNIFRSINGFIIGGLIGILLIVAYWAVTSRVKIYEE